MNCVTVSYGRVRGRAKNYPYHQPAEYRMKSLSSGRVVWEYVGHLGTARRSLRLAEEDAKAYARSNKLLFIPGVRHNQQVSAYALGESLVRTLAA